MTRRAKATQKNATATTTLFAKPEDWDRLEGRVKQLVEGGYSEKKAERIAATELRKGELNG